MKGFLLELDGSWDGTTRTINDDDARFDKDLRQEGHEGCWESAEEGKRRIAVWD